MSSLLIILASLLVVIMSFSEKILASDSYPARPITLIIDQGAGGMADVMTRALSKSMEKELGKPIVCENKPGGGQTVARNFIVKSKPDGYTIGTAGISTNIIRPHMETLPFNVMTDHTDIAVYLNYTYALCVKEDAPWKTFEDILTYARKNPGKFTYGTAAIGSPQHIVMEQIAKKEGIKWSAVPFKSGSEPVLACLGGHVDAVAQGPADLVPQIQAGKLRMIFSLSEERWAIAPNIPSVMEKYGFYGLNYKSIVGPKGMQDQVVEKLQNAIKKATKDPAFVQVGKTLQADIYYMSGKDYSKFWRSKYDEMGEVIRAIGLGK